MEQREADYRSWSMGVMEYFSDLYWFEENMVHGPFEDNGIMERVGLKDRLGVNIFEGDILRTVNGDVGAVVYVAPTFEVTISADQSCSYSREWWDQCEVIGNIYEHPHLLSGGN